MDKDDMMIIIEACCDFNRLDKTVQSFTDGIGISMDFNGLWHLADIIIKHGKIDDMDAIMEILEDRKLSAKQKYEKIVG